MKKVLHRLLRLGFEVITVVDIKKMSDGTMCAWLVQANVSEVY
jgi:hypothetical protein